MVEVPAEYIEPAHFALAVTAAHALAGVAEGVQAFVGRVVGALQVERILDVLEAVHLVFHIGADRFPVGDGQGQAGAGKFQGEVLATLGMMEADAHGVLALDAILGGALSLDYPGGEGFPGNEDRFGVAFRNEAGFTALAIEAGGDDFAVLEMLMQPNTQTESQCE